MDTTNAPQIMEHHKESLTFTPYDTRWIPGTAKFCLFGQRFCAGASKKGHEAVTEGVKIGPRSVTGQKTLASE